MVSLSYKWGGDQCAGSRARDTTDGSKEIAEAATAVAKAAHETVRHNSVRVAAKGQAAKEHGDEGGRQEALSTVVYEDPPIVYARKRGTKKDNVVPGEGLSKHQRKVIVAKRLKVV